MTTEERLHEFITKCADLYADDPAQFQELRVFVDSLEEISSDPAALVTALAAVTSSLPPATEAMLANLLIEKLCDTKDGAALLETDVPGLLREPAFDRVFFLHLFERDSAGNAVDSNHFYDHETYLAARVAARANVAPEVKSLALVLSQDWAGTIDSLLETAAALHKAGRVVK